LTAAPVAVFVADGWVVVVLVDVLGAVFVDGVFVDGTVEVDEERDGGFVVEELAECGVVVDGVVEELEGLVVELDGREVEPCEFVAGGDPAAIDELDEPRVAEALGREPRLMGADFVWKVKTPARPATVAARTIGVRFIDCVPREHSLVGASSTTQNAKTSSWM
jgi:hypothetical protein